MRLLLVEDEELIGQGLRLSLTAEGYDVTWTRTWTDADSHLAASAFDIMLLDLSLPDGDGIDLLKQIRNRSLRLPVLIITARNAVEDRVRGLDLGGDDYLTKPFAIAELLSRIRVLMRRSAGFASEEWTVGEVRLSRSSRMVFRGEDPVELSPREFDVLQALMRNAGRVVTRDALAYQLDLKNDACESNVLEVYVFHLRKKLGADFIRTIRGVGYMVGR
jgi:DNA-binding response OmpR family regulator